MIHSSPGSATEAPVQTGRASRRVSPPNRHRTVRSLFLAALTVLLGLTLTPSAAAHEGADSDIIAVLDRVTPEMPGVSLTVETTRLGSQFVLENPTQTEVTILSSVGDPLFRIGPGGVLGNFRSPEWYTSKVPDGAITIPERAVERGTPVWARVSDEPAWGWFDHRLHSATLSPEQKLAAKPLESFGQWSVPLKFGEALGVAEGHQEYRPGIGTFTPSLSESEPAPGVTLTALQGNPVPAIAINNAGPSEVVVLGEQGEPYLKVTANGAEANQLSKTWIRSQDPSAVAGSGADPAAPPQWVPVGTNGQYAYTFEGAGPEQDLAELYALESETVVRNWTVSLLVDGKPVDIPGETTLTPIGAEGFWGPWTIAGLVLVLLVVAAAVVFFLRRKRAARSAAAAAAPEKVDAQV